MSEPAATFGALLRHYRLAAGLSQAALAERAGLSPRAIGALETGERRAPYPHTVDQLARALGLTAADRAALLAAIPRRPTSKRAPAVIDKQPALPATLTSFVGRERELDELRRLLGTTRLLTLTGAGGVGKTRLTIELARTVAMDFPDGVWLVALAALVEPALVPAIVSSVLGIQERARHTVTDTLVEWLKGRQALLVLDNCEHLLDACATLVETVLQSCPHVHLLITSREGLRVAGEIAWRVPSLATPEPAQVVTTDLMAWAAVRLFFERAAAVQPGFSITATNATAVANVCQRLDGLPLAIELAAAWMGVMTVEQLADRLADQFLVLTGGSRTALPRQQTLYATIDWSYALLEPAERILLRRLAVFAGGWTLPAAEAVCAANPLSTRDVLPKLRRLIDQSLVQADVQTGDVRHRLLETVRLYADQRLQEAGEAESVRARHAEWCRSVADNTDHGAAATAHQAWLAVLDIERDNLRAALAWCVDNDAAAGLRLAVLLTPYWRERAHFSEGLRWLDPLLAAAPAATRTRAQALLAAGQLGHELGDQATAATWSEEGLAISRAVGDQPLTAAALRILSSGYVWRGWYARAQPLLEEALALARAEHDLPNVSEALWWLGTIAQGRGQYARARAWLDENCQVALALGDDFQLSRVCWQLGRVNLSVGDDAQAERELTEGLAIAESLGAPRQVAVMRSELAAVSHWRGHLATAEAGFRASLAVAREAQDDIRIAWALVGLGRTVTLQGDSDVARSLLSESLSIFSSLTRPSGVAIVECALGWAALDRQEPAAAATHLRTSLSLHHELSEPEGIAECLEALAVVAAGTARPVHAAHLVGAADALRQCVGAPLPPVDRPRQSATTSALQAALGDDGYAEARAAGAALPLADAVAAALANANMA